MSNLPDGCTPRDIDRAMGYDERACSRCGYLRPCDCEGDDAIEREKEDECA